MRNTSTSAARQTALNEVILFTVNMQTCVKIIADFRAQMRKLLMPRLLTKLFGKAAGLDSLTAKHLKYSHPALATVRAKLFNIMLIFGCLPSAFGRSYIVPLPKGGHAIGKCLTVEDFRGISISHVLSKICEHCLLDLYATFFTTSDNQFGFKKGLSCSNAIYFIRTVIDGYIAGCSTVSLCALDLSKAFDKMNHHALLIKLKNRQVPINSLEIIENLFELSCTCIKWALRYLIFSS